MDVDLILPAHGDVASRADVPELAAMLADQYATVKAASARASGSTSGQDLDARSVQGLAQLRPP